MRLGDLDKLKVSLSSKYLIRWTHEYGDVIPLQWIMSTIDNTPEIGYEDGVLSIESATRRAIELEEAYNNGWSDGFSEGESERTDEIGKWIIHNDFDESCRYGCNQCGNLNNILSNFCPNCGAKMKEVRNDI